MRITMTLIAIVLSAGLMWSGCDKDGGGGTITPGKDTIATPDGACTPACEGKQCGDDGCDGSCGACEDDETCTLGVCVEPQPGPVCGDDLCEAPEGPEDCPEDCEEDGPVCGDDLCTPPETPDTCPDDCGPPGGICGDDECVAPENSQTCPEDCDPVNPPDGCTEDADCQGTPPCPPDAVKGCVCVPGPQGNACVPACDTDADCPDLPGVALICLPQGICGASGEDPICGDDVCVPPENPDTCPEDCDDPVDPPTGCTDDADCVGTPPCPADAAKGCVCVPGANGSACIPACDTDADCPDLEGAELVCLPEGFCGLGGDGPICGDGQCTPPETVGSCPDDCDDPVDPPICSTDADCQGTPPCPPDAPKGCVCLTSPEGAACVPACDTDADCPDLPDIELVCLPEGFCGAGGVETGCGDGQCTPPETSESCPDDCGGGGPSCATDADCQGTPPCPPVEDAPEGCVCVQGPGGGSCVPACVTNADCPDLPDVVLVCSPDGICSPEGGGPQDGCTSDADCVGTPPCPPAQEAPQGCICVTVPDGSICLPACLTDADCPVPPDDVLICNDQGFCTPQGGGPPD